MPSVGPIEIIIVLLILIVIFGPKRIPELGRSIGQGMRNFKQSVTGRDRDDEPSELPAERTPGPAAGEPSAQPAEVVSPRPDTTGSPREGATASPGSATTPDRTRDPGL
jgi:sec-independent protein translocase protein TatA